VRGAQAELAEQAGLLPSDADADAPATDEDREVLVGEQGSADEEPPADPDDDRT